MPSPAKCRVFFLVLVLETAKVSLFAADSTRARNIRAPDGYPKRTGAACNYESFVIGRVLAVTRHGDPGTVSRRTGTERHVGRQFSSTGKLIASLHAQKGDQRQRDQKMLRRTDKGVTFLFVGLFVGSTEIYRQST